MTGSTLRDAAEAAWNEDGATPARGTLTPPVPRSERPPSTPPAHPLASTDVTSLRVTGHNMTAPTYWHGGPRIHGDRVLSPEVTGRTRSGDYGVHVTTERTLAEAYASTIKGTPWVYEVIPEGVLEPVTSFVGGPTISYRCASARIVRRFSVPRETRAAYRDLIMPMLGTVR